MLGWVLVATPFATVLLTAAGMKVADRTGVAVAAATYGIGGVSSRWAWLVLAVAEAGLALGLLGGSRAAAWGACGVLGAFAGAQAGALLAGRGGAPCGCFGGQGRLSWWSALRAAALAAVAGALALAVPLAPTAGWLVASAVAAGLGAAVVLGRAVRAGTPAGALEIVGEGPPLGARLDLGDGVRLALFTAAGCRLCRALRPEAERLGAAILDEHAHASAWTAARVPGAPFAVALGADGTVLAKGTVNTPAQLASVAAAARKRTAAGLAPAARGREAAGRFAPGPKAPAEASPSSSAGVLTAPSDRRGFLAWAGGAVAAVTAGRTVGSLIAPGEAEAYHFCGHIYTTDGCPHPTGLPRIDARGFPLRARDGHRVDDLGRPVNADGEPVDEAGDPLLDPDGRPLPPAPRTRVCTATGRRYDIRVQTDGAWYRCCNGRVRKLVDCCATHPRRINGDRALRGYCYRDRKVFCVMYFQTRVPC